MATRFVEAPNATGIVKREALPATVRAAEAIAGAIPDRVPVHHGVARASYHPSVVPHHDGAQVFPGSPFWHWLEYGTMWNAPYRPIENAVRGLGLRYEAH